MMKKLMGVLCLLVAFAASGLFVPAPASAAGVKDTIIFAYETEPANLSTVENNAIAAYYPCFMIYSGLFKNTTDGIEKDLCTDYHIEKNAQGLETIWVFKIREGVKFSDGSDLTAKDVVATLKYAQTRPTVKSLTNWYTDVEAVDDYTVKIMTAKVFSTAPEALSNKACYILPSELIASGHDFNNKPVGSGPFKLSKWAKGDSITFVSNENYYHKDKMPKIKEVVWKIIAEGTSRSIALETGEVDFVINVDALDIPRLQENEDVVVSVTDGSMFTYLALNNAKGPFKDENLRKAISCAVNRESIIAVALENFGAPIYSSIPIIMDGWTMENATTFDLDKAREYLKTWGGDPSSLKFAIIVSTDVRRRAAEVIQSNLLEIGINCTIEQVDSATLTQVYNSGDFMSYISAYTSNDLLTWLNGVFRNTGTSSSQFRQAGLDMNGMIDSIAQTTDPTARKALVTEVNKTINAQQPFVPIYQSKVLIAYNANLEGVEIDPMGMFRLENFYWRK
jgi:peptide/nickel transport system substrate-binding protein